MGCLWLIGVGSLAEAIGFLLLAVQLVRVQRREFGRPEFVRRADAWLRRVFSRHPNAQTVHLEAVASAEAAGKLTVKVGVRPGAPLQERVERLEGLLEKVDQDLQAARTDMETRASMLGKQIAEARTELQQALREQEKSRRGELKESIVVQAWGTGFFVVGLFMSFAGNAWDC